MASNSPPISPTPSLKGKHRVVSFAPSVNTADIRPHSPSERSPLLSRSPRGIDGGGAEEEEDEDDELEDEAADQLRDLPFPSRLHRKLKKGLIISGARVRRAGKAAFPNYRSHRAGDEDDEEITTQKVLLYSILFLVVIAVILGGVVLVQSTEDDHPTGPFPRPPRPTSTPSGTELPDMTSTRPPFSFPTYPFPSGLPRNPAYLAKGKYGGVATENKECSDIGIDMLKAGGSAVDAAIAGTLCIGTVNMFSSGIGGGGFMTIRIPPTSAKHSTSTGWTIDFRETVPAAGNATIFGKDQMKALFGGLSVGVPGEIKGMAEAHKRWGRLPWKTLVMPSAKIAAGWKVGKELDRRLKWLGDFMLDLPDWMAVFAPNGTLLTEGDIIRRTNFSRTLVTLANEGPEAFYSPDSPIAQAMVNKVQSEGGILTLDDLQNYEANVARALEGTYRGRKIYTTGAPTSGPALLHILNLLEGFDLSQKEDGAVNLHRVVEAMKFGFAARTIIGDPLASEDVERMSKLHTKEYAQEILPKITDDTTHPPAYYNPVFGVPEDHGTTHISVIDRDGMAVSLTSTVNLVFGSRILDPVTGIIMNDELADFSLPGAPNVFGFWPSPYNFPEAGKRPLSSITPVITEHRTGDVHLALGGSGGSRIFPAVMQVILNHLDLGLDISQAVERPRVHDQLFPMETSVESTFWTAGLDDLRSRGHNVTTFDINLGVAEVQAVSVGVDGTVYAASDSRKNGVASAY